MNLERIYQYMDSHTDSFVADLAKLIRQPSVSAKGEGIQECASLVEKMMRDIGLSTRILEEKKEYPVIYGEIRSKDSHKTLLFYNHYDVQPPDPLEKWTFEPFGGELADGKIYGRGASDNKGNLISRLKAVEALLKVLPNIPVNIKFLVEGEEEIGSPNLKPLIEKNANLLSSEGAIWEFGGTDRKGRPILYLGLKGVLSVEIRAEGASKDAHSANAPLIPNPAWSLVWALGSLKDTEERILVDGFYENVSEPSKEEINCLESIPFEEEETRREFGLKELLQKRSGVEALKALLYQPTCTINGLISGYIGEGSKTVLPQKASAKLDFRLVPNQRSAEIFEKLVKHLRLQDLGNFEVVKFGSTEPTKTPVDDPFVEMVGRTAGKVYGKEAVVYPTSAGSGPMHLFRNLLGCPVVSVGCSHPEANTHAPNENLKLNSFIKGTKFIATLISDFAYHNR